MDHRAALKSKLTEAHFHNADMERIIEMWQEQVTLLTEHIDEIEVRIKKLISSDQNLTERHKTMQKAPGMGKVLGPLWLSLFVGKDQINPRNISSRFGFAPHPHRSGSPVRSPDQSTGFGNSEMRRVMHQAALSVKRNYPHYHEYYNRKRAEGKHHLPGINNIINKLIRLYCAMWNNRKMYDPDHIRKEKKKLKKSA